MSGPSHDIPEFAARFEAPDPPGRRGAGIALGALAVAMISGGLAWWLSGDDRGRMVSSAQATPTPIERPAEPRISLAATAPDPGQVRRAYDEVQAVYADGGAPALAGHARECAETLEADPRILDYCLAFDMYAAALAPKDGEAAQWFQVGEARRLRLTREALPPGGDPEARLAEIRLLMKRAAVTPEAPVLQQATAETRQAAATPPRKAAATKAASRCRFEPTPAQRILCANPQLQAADRRMQQAYRRALAAGADREVLEGEQAAWRTMRNAADNRREMAEAYARRLRELETYVASN